MSDDQVERDLVTLFRERTTSTTYPPVPPALLDPPTASGRRRPWLVAGAAAAAVVVAVAGAGLAGTLTGDAPEPAAPPTGPEGVEAPHIPYVHDGVLHVGATRVPTTAEELRTAGDTVLLTDVSSDDAGREVSRSWVLRGDALVPLPYLDDAQPALSTDGSRVAALSHPEPTTTRLRVRDLADGDVVGTLDLPAAGACCWSGAIQLLGFEPAGRVVYSDDGTSHVWDPTEPSALLVTGTPGPVVQTTGEGVLVAEGRYGNGARHFLGELSDGGRLLYEFAFRMPEPGEPASWSPEGEALVAYTTNAGAVVASLEGRERVLLDLGDRVRRSYAGWESDDAVLVVASRGPAYELLRCGLDGGCEVVADMGGVDELSDWVFPMP